MKGGGSTKMKYVTKIALNARRMNTRERVHAHIKERMRLPEWYGNNLDALNDCLGNINKPTWIILRFAPDLERALGDYGKKLNRVLLQAAEQNPNLRVTLRRWL
ncbi:MAG: barnase inhibitor [Clostridiales bacterium]|nr:barnase inhibitor [Clostridiales bacterium]